MSSVLSNLRRRLALIGVVDGQSYRTHDFRRGHARDIQFRGGSLRELLEAGEWRSCAFLKYLDLVDLERDIVVQAHLDESSDEEV